ncbi:ribose-5-phosphate isomerase [Candidatus Nomurabacteria bacterium RIFCSPLOWO2_01_FULL_33_24]|uniref:Ribose-5-phosphate isomerase n=1 Tax=Candidatus Nomurabacteria bacterium RIFCSPLOWO2_01_FULL_33_24 TaxID=1801765 RepID=A0A1F6X0I4_9BACT|nr:MAG: ribose-5-phosphate isomerase [Candidatus Nomurabacteria bacterium RIFCSPLOWO2_01_FULL_33_24]
MKIYLGGDHAGFELKNKIGEFLRSLGCEIEDLGPYILDINDDYPDFVHEVAKVIANNPKQSRGVIIGGSGQGEAMCANRVPGVRAVVFYGPHLATQPVDAAGRQSDDPYEVIRLAREHNDANILSLAVRFLTEGEAKQAVKIFLETLFSDDARHIRRIKKIDD